MESNNNDSYVLVLEDHMGVKNASEASKLSVISGTDDKDKLQTIEAKDVYQAALLKFSNKNGLLKNFMANLLKQSNEPSRFGLHRVVANNVEQGIASSHITLQNHGEPENKQQLADSQVRFDDFLPKQKNVTAADESKIDWRQLDSLELTRERLEQSGELVKILDWQKGSLMTIATPIGGTTIHTDARLTFRTGGGSSIRLVVHPLRRELQLDFSYMGHKFSNEEEGLLLAMGNLGKTTKITPKSSDSFATYVSIDSQTSELIALRASRVNIPKEVKGVTLSDTQHRGLAEGRAVKVEGMTAKSGGSFNATLQVNTEKKGIEFIFESEQGLKKRQQYAQQQGAPCKPCGLELSDKQREASNNGHTSYLKDMADKEGQPFNTYVKMDKGQNCPYFYKWNFGKKQEVGREKVVVIAEEHKTQVTANSRGKTNEAIRNVNESLESGQTQPTAAQEQRQGEKKQQRRGRKM